MQKFTPTKLMIDAAHSVFVAMAIEQTIRKIVEAYQYKILAEKQWAINSKYVEREGKFITDIKLSYLMTDEDFAKFHQRCNEERIKEKLHVDHTDKCPLLVAESTLMDARFSLASVMEPVTKISEESLRGALSEDCNQYFELTLSLLAPFVKTEIEPT